MGRAVTAGHRLRHPYDKRAYVRPVLALLASFAAAIGMFCILSHIQPSVENGSALPVGDGVWAISDERWDEGAGRVSAALVVDAGREISLAVVRPASGDAAVRANGVVLGQDSGRLAELRQVGVYPVPEGLFAAEAEADGAVTVRFEVEVLDWMGSDALYVGPSDALYDAFYLLNQAMKVCALTMLAVMVFYALSLFFAKRSETYLMPFVAYTAFLIVWISLANVPGPGFLPMWLFNFVQVCGHFYVAYIPSVICVLLSGIEIPTVFKPLVHWYGLLFVPLLFGTVGYSVDFGATMGVMTALCLALAGWALVRSVALGHPGAMVLVVGFGVTIGFKLAATLVDVGLVDDSVVLYAMRKARLLNVPVVIAVMLYLNQLFARNFRKTEDMNALLERLVEQRTAELRQQQGMRLGMMVNIFHDLRGPLFTIQKCVDALGAEATQDGRVGGGGLAAGAALSGGMGRAGIVGILADRTAFLARLIEDLFTAAKLEDGDCLLAEAAVDVEGVLADVVLACRPLAAEQGVCAELVCDGAGPAAGGFVTWGDRRYLARAFENLAVNAIQHAPRGSRVVVGVARNKGSLRVFVHNEGEPIAPEDLAHVFERYYRRNTKAPAGSSGIGLSIVRAVTERHRGTVDVTSTASDGTTFTMVLPLLDAEGRGSQRCSGEPDGSNV